MQVLVTHQLRNESLAHGSVKRSRRAKEERKHIDVPKLDAACDCKSSQRQREYAHRCLGHHQEPALVEAIRSQSGPGQQKKLRCKLQGHDDAHSRSIMVSELREDEPVLSNTLHPRPDV
jgi:hypothetical protein